MSLINFNTYDGSPAPPSRRRRPRWPFMVAGLVAVLVVALVVTLRAGGDKPQQTAAAPATDPSADLVFAQTRQQGACLDGLFPTPDGWAQHLADGIRDAVAHLEDGQPDPKNIPNDGSGKPNEGLKLWVKAVYTNSLSTDNPQYTAPAAVTSVPAVKLPRPKTSGPTDPAYQLWSAATDKVRTALLAAKTDASRSDTTLGALQFPPHDSTYSGVSGCMTGLLRDVPTVVDPHTNKPALRSFLVATDCNEPVTPQLDGDFRGDTLYIIQSCVSGDLAECGHYLQQFSDRMRQLHVGTIVVVPKDHQDEAISAWVKTGGWQP
ncbi:MAG: hypothetical protein JWN03_859 [Nocardia sp.]|uniref:hypothetical protein n=1 Tax=Nocardia sp. TaxID=1821 RepID=UPI0026045554|nr:hypothetical protein [Nocardia sp.]MCU1640584.1 hypothetical protein [Nocardia sp.]